VNLGELLRKMEHTLQDVELCASDNTGGDNEKE